MEFGVRMPRSPPYQAQSLGKDERFHRALAKEMPSLTWFRGPREARRAFDSCLPVFRRSGS